MDESNSGLLIAALVAIVAVVGLVILFKGSATGHAVCPPGQSLQMVMNMEGGQDYYACQPSLKDVKYIPQNVDQMTPDPIGSSFQTVYQAKERDRQIAQRAAQ